MARTSTVASAGKLTVLDTAASRNRTANCLTSTSRSAAPPRTVPPIAPRCHAGGRPRPPRRTWRSGPSSRPWIRPSCRAHPGADSVRPARSPRPRSASARHAPRSAPWRRAPRRGADARGCTCGQRHSGPRPPVAPRPGYGSPRRWGRRRGAAATARRRPIRAPRAARATAISMRDGSMGAGRPSRRRTLAGHPVARGVLVITRASPRSTGIRRTDAQ